MPETTPYGRGNTDPSKTQQGRSTTTPGRDAGEEPRQPRMDKHDETRTHQKSDHAESTGCGCGGADPENGEVGAGGDETSIDSSPHPSNPEA